METNENQGKLPVYKKILIPVDFTDCSMNACIFAVGLAGRLKAEIELMHAYYSPEITSLPYDESFSFQGTLTEFLREGKEKARQELEEFGKKVKEFIEEQRIQGVQVGTSLLRGMPSEATLYMADSYHPDMIVVGTRSADQRKEASGYLVHIVRDARVPVLVIPENCRFDQSKPLSNVAYATDYDESDFMAIKKLMGLIAAFGLKVYCVHVGSKTVSDEERLKMNGLKEYFAQYYRDFQFECLVTEHDDIIDGLEKVLDDKKINILALTTHRRNLIQAIINPSLTRKLYFHTRIPLLVFHS